MVLSKEVFSSRGGKDIAGMVSKMLYCSCDLGFGIENGTLNSGYSM